VHAVPDGWHSQEVWFIFLGCDAEKGRPGASRPRLTELLEDDAARLLSGGVGEKPPILAV
jgi:hypothetical protein